jgi:NADPH:quinone reductase-like Zn-dependent oxidoreductase
MGEFAVGDHVFGSTGLRFGAHAEFTCVPEGARIAPKPAGMSFEEATAMAMGVIVAEGKIVDAIALPERVRSIAAAVLTDD